MISWGFDSAESTGLSDRPGPSDISFFPKYKQKTVHNIYLDICAVFFSLLLKN